MVSPWKFVDLDRESTPAVFSSSRTRRSLPLLSSALIDLKVRCVKQLGVKIAALSFRDFNNRSKSVQQPDHPHGGTLIRPLQLGPFAFDGCGEGLQYIRIQHVEADVVEGPPHSLSGRGGRLGKYELSAGHAERVGF